MNLAHLSFHPFAYTSKYFRAGVVLQKHLDGVCRFDPGTLINLYKSYFSCILQFCMLPYTGKTSPVSPLAILWQLFSESTKVTSTVQSKQKPQSFLFQKRIHLYLFNPIIWFKTNAKPCTINVLSTLDQTIVISRQ